MERWHHTITCLPSTCSVYDLFGNRRTSATAKAVGWVQIGLHSTVWNDWATSRWHVGRLIPVDPHCCSTFLPLRSRWNPTWVGAWNQTNAPSFYNRHGHNNAAVNTEVESCRCGVGSGAGGFDYVLVSTNPGNGKREGKNPGELMFDECVPFPNRFKSLSRRCRVAAAGHNHLFLCREWMKVSMVIVRRPCWLEADGVPRVTVTAANDSPSPT